MTFSFAHQLSRLRIKWIKQCKFDLTVHENVKEFPEFRLMECLGRGLVHMQARLSSNHTYFQDGVNSGYIIEG